MTALHGLSTVLWLHGDEFWAGVEAQRQADAPVILLTVREAAHATDEFIRRWGYEGAKEFIRLVLDGKGRRLEAHPLTSLAVSLRCRFGRRGLVGFAGFLSVYTTAHEVWRGRGCA